MITTLTEAWEYLTSLIMNNQPFREHPEIPYRRAQRLLELLGNPQNRLKVIHLAGTSGKGSTAYYMNRLLIEHGFKVGLHISPHLTDIRERFQIDNGLVDNAVFLRYLNKVKQASDAMARSEFGKASYFEALVGLSFLLFYENKVDYAVMETGMGGWYDATNAVSRQDKVCIITSIGMDHMNALGDTLEKIALQKAKIIRNGNLVVAQPALAPVRRVIEEVASAEKARLTFLEPGTNYRNVRLEDNRVVFDFSGATASYDDIHINTPALYQGQNAATALLALIALAKRDGFEVAEDKVRHAFAYSPLAGRMDIVKTEKGEVLFDGAHNPQKMHAFLASLKASFPGRKFHFLIAFKKGKAYPEMIQQIAPLAKSITVTRFVINVQDSSHLSEDPAAVASLIRARYPNVTLQVESDPDKAYNIARNNTPEKEILVITGSLYLLSCLYTKV